MLTCHLISDNYTYWHLLLVQLVTLHWVVRIQCIRRTHVFIIIVNVSSLFTWQIAHAYLHLLHVSLNTPNCSVYIIFPNSGMQFNFLRRLLSVHLLSITYIQGSIQWCHLCSSMPADLWSHCSILKQIFCWYHKKFPGGPTMPSSHQPIRCDVTLGSLPPQVKTKQLLGSSSLVPRPPLFIPQ